MGKADYRHIALSYDQGRPLLEQNIDLWLGLVTKLARMSEGARVLDLGCGTGRFSIPMVTKLRFRVTGADSSREMLDRAREKDTGKLVKWDLEDAQHLTYPDESFDVVFCLSVLEHAKPAKEIETGIEQMKRVLKPGGKLILTVDEVSAGTRWGMLAIGVFTAGNRFTGYFDREYPATRHPYHVLGITLEK